MSPTVLTTLHADKALDYLRAALVHHSKAEVARFLEVNARTIRRWELRETEPPAYVTHSLQLLLPFQYPIEETRVPDFTFIDLFAGIGGIRSAFEGVGGKCVYTSEWDSYAQKTYVANFPSDHPIAGDITQVHESDIPDHDVLLGGFPCQPFSIAGVSKKNALGRKHGFADETQGTLFFDVARIIAHKRPRAFLLENVKNLQSHDKGRTFAVIRRTLEEELGYQLHYKVIDGAHFVPQHRERILMVGFRDRVNFSWDAVNLPIKGNHKLGKILHRTDGTEPVLPWDEGAYFDAAARRVPDKYTLTDNLWTYLQAYKEKHQAAGNGFGFGLVGPDSVTRTLSARYYKDGSEILLVQSRKRNPRRLTPRECARLMGFPDTFKIPVSDTRAYKQFGNSVVLPVMTEAAKAMSPFIAMKAMEPKQAERSVAYA